MVSSKRVSEATLLLNVSLIATLDQLVTWQSYKKKTMISKPEGIFKITAKCKVEL